VPNSQNSASSTQSTLAQLLDIDSQLSSQEAQLRSQLESIQEKRKSLQVVISLFTGADKTDVAPFEEKASLQVAQIDKEPENFKESQAFVESDKDELLTTSLTTPGSKKEKKAATSSKKKSQTRKSQLKRTFKQAPGWQHYLRAEFRNSSLPQAVSSVLQSQTELVWEIAAIIEALFVEKIPQEVKKKVRHQITNILAQGVTDNKWYRVQQGSYTMSRASIH
jgi:hypothetical protein